MNNHLAKHLFWKTLWNALLLNASFYEHARRIPNNYRIAQTIVLLAALSHTIGSLVILVINQASLPNLLLALVLDGCSIVASYYVWTVVVLKVGQWLKPIDPTYTDLLSPIGFAYAPQVLNFLTLIPLLGQPIERILAIWSLLAVIVAVRQGLDIRTRSATLICLMGWIPIQMAIGLVQVLEQRLVQ